MKILLSVVRGLIVLGLGPQRMDHKYPINSRSLKTLFALFFGLGLSFAYIFLEAQTFEDYTLSLYVCITVLLGGIGFIILMWKNRPICDLIDKTEKTINESKGIPK